MTTASKPTWCPAKGNELEANAAPSLYYSAKDQLAHKKLKLRQPGQHSVEEVQAKKLQEEKMRLELTHSSAEALEGDSFGLDHHADKNAQKDEDEPQLEDSHGDYSDQIHIDQELVSAEDADEIEDVLSSDKDEEEEDDEDDTELLLLELEKIKRERAKEKKELAEAEDAVIMASNPLRFQDKTSKALVSWTEDTVFRNQAIAENKPKKRFINDMGRSDFHRKFMEKYIR